MRSDVTAADGLPLRRVERVVVSDRSGSQLNPHYMWCVRDYMLILDCGHVQARARMVTSPWNDPAPELLQPPLPARVRCPACRTAPTPRRAPRKPKPAPRFDPVAGALVAAMCTGMPDRQDTLLDWAAVHGRHEPDPAVRDRAYAAMALTAIDAYAADTVHPAVPCVRAAITRWADEPTDEGRALIRRHTRHLYNAQHSNSGSWYAHRGIIDAARIVSPQPHCLRAAVTCPTWDSPTRAAYYRHLWDLRDQADDASASADVALLTGDHDLVRQYADDAQALRAELGSGFRDRQPVIGERHADLTMAMLTAYQHAVAQPSEGE